MPSQPQLRRRAWALWSLLVLVLLICPALVAGPMIAYVLDPEMLLLAVLCGTQSGRMELGVLWLRVRTAPQRLRRRSIGPRPRMSCLAPAHTGGSRSPSRGPGGPTRPGRPTRASVRPGSRTAQSRYPARPR